MKTITQTYSALSRLLAALLLTLLACQKIDKTNHEG